MDNCPTIKCISREVLPPGVLGAGLRPGDNQPCDKFTLADTDAALGKAMSTRDVEAIERVGFDLVLHAH
jgi:hypothetical protein